MSSAIQSRIEEVTVFRRGAQITRVAQVEGGPGFPKRVRLTGLPMALDDSSVRVRLETPEGTPPLATDVGVALEVPAADDRLTPPTDEKIESAREAVERSAALHTNLVRRAKTLRGLKIVRRPAAEEGHPPIPSPREGRHAILEFRDTQLEVLEQKIFDAEDTLDDARKQLARLEDDRQRASNALQARPEELRKSVIVTLQGESTAPDARMFVDYRVPGARWAPSYTVRLDDALSTGELGVSALVRQRTGEDWSDARIRLSTAMWQQWADLPKLKALRIGRRQPRPAPAWRPPPAGAQDLFRDYDDGFSSDSTPPVPAASMASAPREITELRASAARVAIDGFRDEVTLEAAADFGDDEEVTGSYAVNHMPEMVEDVPAPRSAAPVMMSRSMSIGAQPMAKKAGVGIPYGGRAVRRPRTPVEPELALNEDLFDYGRLRVAGPGDLDRGKLVLESRADRYRRQLALQHVHVSVDVFQLVLDETHRAEALEESVAPHRHFFAESDAGFDYAFETIGRCDVPSDGRDRSLPIALETVSCRPHFVVVPRESRDVFREVRVTNPLDAPLLRGPIDVYVANSYLSTVDLSTVAPRGALRLGLGVEQAIKVSRNARYEEQAAGLIRGSRDLMHAVDMEIINNTARVAQIEVRERIPVSEDGDDDVKVTVDRVQPAWDQYEPDDALLRGGHRWRLDVGPEEKQAIELRYSIRIKAGEELVGGNRREV